MQSVVMPQNPHVRTIRLFNPAADLAVDDADPRRVRKRRPPVNPAEGLLDDDGDDVLVDSAPGAAASQPAADPGYTRVEPEPRPSAAPDSAVAAASDQGPDSSSPGNSEKFESSVLGEVPEMIEGDFPEPVDL